MDTEKQRIFEVVKANLLKVMIDLKPEQVTIDQSMTDLGANSVDRVEVVMYSMEELGLDIPRAELHGAKNIAGLVEILARHLSK
ncbi:MAG TPA: phosphopantetheine-binding protein [Opitutaceae bacterium]